MDCDVDDLDPPLLIDTVTTNYSVDLRLVSDVVEAPVQEIAGPQPEPAAHEHVRRTPHSSCTCLRAAKSSTKNASPKSPKTSASSWRYHKLVPGETLRRRWRKITT